MHLEKNSVSLAIPFRRKERKNSSNKIEMWENYLKGFKSYLLLEKGYSNNTKEAYIRDCEKLLEFLHKSHSSFSPKDLDYKHIQAFLKSINLKNKDKEDSLLEISTQKRLISGIRAFYKYLLIENIVDKDPTEMVELPRLDKKLPVVLSNKEIVEMIDKIDKTTYRGAWINLMVEILYGAGLRISELLNLKLTDIFHDEGLIKVIGKGDKQRWVPLNEIAFKQIDIFVQNTRSQIKPHKGCEQYIFLNHRGGQLSRIAAFQAIKELGEKAGIKKNIHPHTFRHSFATELILGGADIMVVRELMGHVSVSSTEIYTHINSKRLKETLLLYHPLYNKGYYSH